MKQPYYDCYRDRILDFERRIAPYIDGKSVELPYREFLNNAYIFTSNKHRKVWARCTLVLGLKTWGSRSLLVAVGWDGEKVNAQTLQRVQAWANAHGCADMFLTREWGLEGRRIVTGSVRQKER